MEVAWFSTPKEGMAKSQEDQDRVNCFLIGKTLPITSTPLWAKQLIRSSTSVFFVSWEMQYDENGHKYRQLVIGSFIMGTHPLMYYVWCRVFWETSNHPGDSALHNPDLVSCNFWFFPKLWVKSPLKRKGFQTIDDIQENMSGQLMAIPTKDFAECFEQWKRPCMPALQATKVSLSYVQCSLYLVSSINVSIFHIMKTIYGLILSDRIHHIYHCITTTCSIQYSNML